MGKRANHFLGRAAGLFLAGQAVALFKKDPDFKWKRKEAEGFDKVKVLAESLFAVNKSLVEEVKNYDYAGTWSSIQTTVHDQYDDLESRVRDLASSAKEYSQSAYESAVETFETQFASLKETIGELELTDRKAWEKKLGHLQDSFLDRKDAVSDKIRGK